MPRPTPLDPDALREALRTLPLWRLEGDELARDLRFADFNEAFGFMTRVALVAERMDHHPDWSNVHARVRVRLTTHDAGGISELDLELARAIDRIAGAVSGG